VDRLAQTARGSQGESRRHPSDPENSRVLVLGEQPAIEKPHVPPPSLRPPLRSDLYAAEEENYRRKSTVWECILEGRVDNNHTEFRASGWQTGSGLTESRCKTSTSRLKGRGRRWNFRNAEAVAALMTLADSGL